MAAELRGKSLALNEYIWKEERSKLIIGFYLRKLDKEQQRIF
jgi:hypothetical protein